MGENRISETKPTSESNIAIINLPKYAIIKFILRMNKFSSFRVFFHLLTNLIKLFIEELSNLGISCVSD